MSKQYQVALSFAGEQRPYVEEVARGLQAKSVAVFYDAFEILLGKDLAEYLYQVYAHDSDRVVMFILKGYVAKPWTTHERRSAISAAIKAKGDFIIPIRFDDAWPPGIPDTLAYDDATKIAPAEFVNRILHVLGIDPLAFPASAVPPPKMASAAGEPVFNYKSHNGNYVIGDHGYQFTTHWTNASANSIHCYARNEIRAIAVVEDVKEIKEIKDVTPYDFTSSSVTPQEGQIVLIQNKNGYWAALKILDVKAKSHSDKENLVRLIYVILTDGSSDFSMLAGASRA